MLITTIGLLAAVLTSLSYIPQMTKALPSGSTDDLSFKTLAVLAAGLALWIGYGFPKEDCVIMIANTVGLSLVATLIAFEIRDESVSKPRARTMIRFAERPSPNSCATPPRSARSEG